MNELIAKLEEIKQAILEKPFSPGRSIQVDRLDSVLDWLRELDGKG
jgi:hypothetical protein